MFLGLRLALGVTCLSPLVASPVWAQGAAVTPTTETLETPYEEPPAPPQAAPPKAPRTVAEPVAPATAMSFPAPPKVDSRPLGPIRARRRLALTAELGWNGLAGFGPVLTYHAHPNVSLDLGAGFSLFGWKAGARGRYNFLKSPFTPFVGVGMNATTGLGQQSFDPADDPNGDPTRDPVTVDLKPSYLVQGTLGFDFLHRRGFTMIGCLGYSWLLNEDNVDVLDGELTAEEERVVDFAFKSGAVLSLALGYAFE